MGVYSYILTEDEWYGVNEDARKALQDQCLGAAQDSGVPYAGIYVEPDAVMSISPIPRRHKVWGHTFPTDAEKLFRDALAWACGDAFKAGLTLAQVRDIMRKYMENKLS